MANKGKRNQLAKDGDHLEDNEEQMSRRDGRMLVREEADRKAEEDRTEVRLIAAEERAEKRRRAEKIEEEERAEKRRRAEKIEEEERAERIEEEERAERREEARLRREEARLKREKEEKIEADEKAEARAEARAEAKKQRKLEEARAAAKLEAAKEAAAKIAAETLMEQQQAMADRSFKQQEQLMKLQAEYSATAANERRREQEMTKKHDRAVLSVSTYKDGEDIEEYLMTAERKLAAGEVPEGEWLTHMSAKLTGTMGTTWQDLCVDTVDYSEVKTKLLKICGYTPKVAAELFFTFKSDQIRGMTADQVYLREVQLFRRLIAPEKAGERLEFNILKGWVSSIIPRKAKMALDMRSVESVAELLSALQDHLMLEGDRTDGQAVAHLTQYQ